jgi:hypothetical protein
MLQMNEAKRLRKRPMQIANDEVYSISRAAEYKGVSTRAVYQRINAGLLPFMRAGSDTAPKLVYKRDLDAWDVARERQQQVRKGKPQN